LKGNVPWDNHPPFTRILTSWAELRYLSAREFPCRFLDDLPIVSEAVVVAALEQAKAHLIADARAA
jgi:hypothetical protein